MDNNLNDNNNFDEILNTNNRPTNIDKVETPILENYSLSHDNTIDTLSFETNANEEQPRPTSNNEEIQELLTNKSNEALQNDNAQETPNTIPFTEVIKPTEENQSINNGNIINLNNKKSSGKNGKKIVALLVASVIVGGSIGSAAGYALTSSYLTKHMPYTTNGSNNSGVSNTKATNVVIQKDVNSNASIIEKVRPSVVTIGITNSQILASAKASGGFSLPGSNGNFGFPNGNSGNNSNGSNSNNSNDSNSKSNNNNNNDSNNKSSDNSNASGNNSQNNNNSADQSSDLSKNPDIIGAGTGIIFKEDTNKVYVVTNNHVISEADGVEVWLSDAKTYVSAKLVGNEPMSDLAVVSILKTDLAKVGVNKVTVATFGNSDNTRVGDPVIAIGNALGEGISSTGGMISMKNKLISITANNNLTVFQTDAPINPGNSGGPLVDSIGQVIGINTAKLMQSSQTNVEGMGYSITSNQVISTIDKIMANGDKPFLGIEGTTISQKEADAYSLPAMGVVVAKIISGGSASKTDLKVGDVITSFNGQTAKDMETLSKLIKECKVNQTVKIKVMRNGEIVNISVLLQKHEDTSFK